MCYIMHLIVPEKIGIIGLADDDAMDVIIKYSGISESYATEIVIQRNPDWKRKI